MNIILFTNTAHVTRYVVACRHPLLYKDLFSLITLLKPGGYSWEFVVGLCRTVVQILILFQTKNSHFPHPLSDLAEAEIMLSLLRLERQQKRFLKIHFEFAYYSFLLIYLELKRQTRSYTPIFPRKNTRFPTKIGNI